MSPSQSRGHDTNHPPPTLHYIPRKPVPIQTQVTTSQAPLRPSQESCLFKTHCVFTARPTIFPRSGADSHGPACKIITAFKEGRAKVFGTNTPPSTNPYVALTTQPNDCAHKYREGRCKRCLLRESPNGPNLTSGLHHHECDCIQFRTIKDTEVEELLPTLDLNSPLFNQAEVLASIPEQGETGQDHLLYHASRGSSIADVSDDDEEEEHVARAENLPRHPAVPDLRALVKEDDKSENSTQPNGMIEGSDRNASPNTPLRSTRTHVDYAPLQLPRFPGTMDLRALIRDPEDRSTGTPVGSSLGVVTSSTVTLSDTVPSTIASTTRPRQNFRRPTVRFVEPDEQTKSTKRNSRLGDDLP
ncbi:hypothetical protein M011DRAFT_478226 [Sporormia fimetaria CBS 119925]|uniref:Uncharacterized protein n=1 Tax=Sporormia fimetaria CBS 119925 TaxID=1340428 RepID=A0A6A6V6K4_9PLEO|nr:hypothetical protein M011DRAFT_478226 [Sporormia fimetaria CBS 119925]